VRVKFYEKDVFFEKKRVKIEKLRVKVSVRINSSNSEVV
tara:strand:+ start:940 stop:1056 length:117 start_codon:yes stop_codon:yes gene_type:complete